MIFKRRVFKRFLRLRNSTFTEVPHFLKGDLLQIPSAMLKIPKYKREAPSYFSYFSSLCASIPSPERKL